MITLTRTEWEDPTYFPSTRKIAANKVETKVAVGKNTWANVDELHKLERIGAVDV